MSLTATATALHTMRCIFLHHFTWLIQNQCAAAAATHCSSTANAVMNVLHTTVAAATATRLVRRCCYSVSDTVYGTVRIVCASTLNTIAQRRKKDSKKEKKKTTETPSPDRTETVKQSSLRSGRRSITSHVFRFVCFLFGLCN